MKYEELVKALRHCATRSNGCVTCAGCPMSSENGDVIECINALHKDAAAAIEALMDAEKTYLAELAQCHENLRRAAETRRERDERIEALQAELPKRGEWIVFNKQMLINLENAREQYKELGYPHRTELGLQCSNCRKVTYVDSGIKYEFCPHCGAKMEVQE